MQFLGLYAPFDSRGYNAGQALIYTTVKGGLGSKVSAGSQPKAWKKVN